VSKSLGEFEQFVLYGILALGEQAYGAAIHREIHERTGRSVLIGAVYTVLDRLETRGLVSSWIGEPTAERGGRRRKYYRLRAAGAALLREAHESHQRMAHGLGRRLNELASKASR
jgi:DNA-binding PadR family transcriptional regulator